MKALWPASLLAALLAAPAYADCTPPNSDINIPDGNTATKDEMIAAQHAVKTADTAMQQYSECLKAEQDTKLAAGGDQMKDDEKLKIATEYASRQNAEVEKLQKVADKFNVEVRAWKAKNVPPAAPPAHP